MRDKVSYRLLLLVGILSVSIFSLNMFVILPSAVVSDKPQQLLQSAFATFPGENGKIAFVSARDGCCGEIYVMNADGTGQTRLTTTPGEHAYFYPDWSPDNEKIAYGRGGYAGENAEIWVMNADGTGQTNISNNPASDFDPSWSPDGIKIAFLRGGEIYVMNADGTGQTKLTENALAFYPDWSPDGEKIAFSSYRGGFNNYDIWVMNADGTGQTRLTTDTRSDYGASWSPDGTKIVFYRDESDARSQIWVMNADGTGQTNISNNPADEEHPGWSPDGTKIVFFSNRDQAVGEIYAMNADGSNPTRLTNSPSGDYFPDWGSAPSSPPPQEDTAPPVLTVPEDIVVNATIANGGTVVTYNVTAEDNVDGTATLEEDGTTITQDDIGDNITISCEPSSGTEFPIGDTEVQCIATDEAGNVGADSFIVTVNPPAPDPLTAEISSDATEGDAPATFEFETAVTGGTAPYSHRWDFGDGATEEESIESTTSHTYDEPGTYTVTLTVIDSEGQEATDSLEVTVNEPSTEPPPPPPRPTTPHEAIEDLISFIQNLQGVPEGAKTGIVTSLERALALLSDDNIRNDASVCNMFGAFMNQVDAGERRGSLTEVQADDLRTQAEDIRDMLDC